MRHPPGDEIYRDGLISVFEVDGRKNKVNKKALSLSLFLSLTQTELGPFFFLRFTVKTCACWRNNSSITKLSTTMSNPSCSTS